MKRLGFIQSMCVSVALVACGEPVGDIGDPLPVGHAEEPDQVPPCPEPSQRLPVDSPEQPAPATNLEPGGGWPTIELPLQFIVDPIEPQWLEGRDEDLHELAAEASAYLAPAGIHVYVDEIEELDIGMPSLDDPPELYLRPDSDALPVYRVEFISGGYGGYGYQAGCGRFAVIAEWAKGYTLAHEVLHTLTLGHSDDRENLMYPATLERGEEIDREQQERAREKARAWLEGCGA